MPDTQKKIILWAIVAVLAIVMGYFWVRGAMDNLSKIGQAAQNIKFPQIDISNVPSLDILKTTTPSQ